MLFSRKELILQRNFLSPPFSALGTEVAGSSKVFVLLFKTAWCHVPEDDIVTSIPMQTLCLNIHVLTPRRLRLMRHDIK
jgi:hypothetical protein